jgi:hypothetical protein
MSGSRAKQEVLAGVKQKEESENKHSTCSEQGLGQYFSIWEKLLRAQQGRA